MVLRPARSAQRREDIAPNVEYELQRFSNSKQTQIRFDKEAALPICICLLPQAQWRGNFRELSSSIARMRRLPNKVASPYPLSKEDCAAKGELADSNSAA
nr:hypothetical protein [Citrobacter freundii]